MKKLSLIIVILWVLFPFAVKATEQEGYHPDWVWFSIIWLVMGIPGGFAAYFFHMIENYKTEEDGNQ